MRPSPSSFLSSLLSLSLGSFILLSAAFAQTAAPLAPVEPRIMQAVDDAQLTTLRGNTHPLALPRFDRGAALPTMPLERMLLVLKRSPEQDAALLSLLDQQQDKSSPNYHQWLKPEEFGKRFGPADADIQAVTSWLQTHGFQIARVSKGRTVIEFSGTAAMLQEAFRTEMHRYLVNGDPHWANASDPQIPSALAPVVAGVWTLHDFVKKPTLVMSGEHFPLTYPAGSKTPLVTGSSGHHFLAPGDYAVIYGIKPVYQAGIDGTGTTIAVVGRTDFDFGDVWNFRSIFGLPTGNLNLVNAGPDPGNLGGGEEAEAILDATWSGSIAPGATVQFVVSASTDTTDGVDLSALYIVDNDVGDVMTESFLVCEQHVTSAEMTGFSALAQQAAAQGITYMVASGDTGSSGCDNLSETVATGPLGVNALASTPFNVAVGGTIFNENGHDSTYWSSSTTAPVTALKYIPEKVWNESCTSATCGNNANIAAGGGGPSTVVAKPAWQLGASLHIPNDGFRDLPDVSLTAAGHDPYLICYEGSCSSQQGFLYGISGTSASAPSFAGIVALLNQRVGGRIGLANYLLYKLAAGQSQYPTQCNGSSTSSSPNSACIFNDVTSGTNAVPGPNPATQYTAAAGYDLATGLGSVNVNNLLNAWAAATFNSTQTTLTLNPLTITHGANVTVNIGVTAGAGTPTGSVALLSNAGAPPKNGHAVDLFTLNGGLVSSNTQSLPGGTNTITAHYAGDATFGASDSPAVPVTVNAEASNTTITVLTADSNGFPVPFTTGPYGSFVYLRADVVGKSGFGTPTGSASFLDNAAFVRGDFLNSQGSISTVNGIFSLAPGAHALTANYSGDASFLGSISQAANVTITKAATTTSVTSSSAKVGSGSTVTLTATVDTTSGGGAPSGTVAFFNGVTQLPGTAGLVGGISTSTGFSQSTATYQASLPDGTESITAQYLADTNYNGSTSSPLSITVAPDFGLAFTGTSGTTMTIAAPGGSGTLTLSVSGSAGYNGTVNFTGCTGLPLYSKCTFNPTSVTGNGSTTLTVTTTAPRSASNRIAPSVWAATGGFTLAGVFVLGFAPRKRRWASLVALLMFAWVLTTIGCGGSSSGGGGGGTPGTPPGSYNMTATGTDANFTHPVAFTLTVQ